MTDVVVDTSVWSLALRRGASPEGIEARELRSLVTEGRVVLLGPVRQELLSGVPAPKQFETLRDRLGAFPDLALRRTDYEAAADCFNKCRARGIQGSNVDFLIAASSIVRRLSVFTVDGDFAQFAKVLPLRLHAPTR